MLNNVNVSDSFIHANICSSKSTIWK